SDRQPRLLRGGSAAARTRSRHAARSPRERPGLMYGQNSGAIRTELAALLRNHRIQYRLGGPIGLMPQSSTAADRKAMGRQIRRYRRSVLVWCRQAVTATN